MYVYMYVCMHTYVSMYVCMHVLRIFENTHTHTQKVPQILQKSRSYFQILGIEVMEE